MTHLYYWFGVLPYHRMVHMIGLYHVYTKHKTTTFCPCYIRLYITLTFYSKSKDLVLFDSTMHLLAYVHHYTKPGIQ